MNNRLILRIFLLILFLALGTYLFFHFDFHVYFLYKEKTVQLINSFHPYDEIAFISFQILQVVAAPIPGEVTGLVGGYLYGPVLGTIYSTIGLTIGSWLAFLLARIFGLPLVERAVKPETIKKYDYIMEHQGALLSFVLFLIPGFPKDYLCYIMGLSHMTTTTFLIVSTTGRLFGTILLSIFGSYIRSDQYTILFIVVGICAVLIMVAYLYRDKWIEVLRKRKNA